MRGPRPACQRLQARDWHWAALPAPRDRPMLAWIFWRLLDAIDYRVMRARLWIVDALHGPEPETETDRQRKASIERWPGIPPVHH